MRAVRRTTIVGGFTGRIASALVGEYELPMRLFIGAGAGYGVLNNPSGPLVGARVGYYPFEHPEGSGIRRLNVAFDTRMYFVDGYSVSNFALSFGYDRF